MAEQGYEYDQYAAEPGGRLFSSSMFGFNKEEVLEYLDELADENYMHQAAAEQQIADLNQMVMNLQANLNEMQQNGGGGGYNYFENDPQYAEELEVAQAATQQAEAELGEIRDQFYQLQQENEWYRDAYQKNDAQISELHRQLSEAGSGQWPDAAETEQKIAEAEQRAAESQQKILESQQKVEEAQLKMLDKQRQIDENESKVAQLQQQLEDLKKEIEQKKNTDAIARESIIADANAQAERIRAMAVDERDRVRRQMRSSAENIGDSITTLRSEISTVENDVTNVLEAVQRAMNEVSSALSRTEQNLKTLDLQTERFPTPTPSVPKPVSQQQPLYFRQAMQQAAAPRPHRAIAPESLGSGGFRQLEPTPKEDKALRTPRPQSAIRPTATAAGSATTVASPTLTPPAASPTIAVTPTPDVKQPAQVAPPVQAQAAQTPPEQTAVKDPALSKEDRVRAIVETLVTSLADIL